MRKTLPALVWLFAAAAVCAQAPVPAALTTARILHLESDGASRRELDALAKALTKDRRFTLSDTPDAADLTLRLRVGDEGTRVGAVVGTTVVSGAAKAYWLDAIPRGQDRPVWTDRVDQQITTGGTMSALVKSFLKAAQPSTR